MRATNCNARGTTANLPNVFHQTHYQKKKRFQRKVKIHLLVRRQMRTHWEAVRAISSGVWIIITQLLKHSPQMQVDSTFVTMKDSDTYWSQGRDMEWGRCSETLQETRSPQMIHIVPASRSISILTWLWVLLLKINQKDVMILLYLHLFPLIVPCRKSFLLLQQIFWVEKDLWSWGWRAVMTEGQGHDHMQFLGRTASAWAMTVNILFMYI